jgi:glutathione S-transferase
MEYIPPKKAQEMPGMRLALTAGVPGPWSESAKSIFRVKGIDFVPVLQQGNQPNEDLVAWTGHRNAPVAVWQDEAPRAGWAEILVLAERLSQTPMLTPHDATNRTLMFGLSNEICGEGGLGWARRIMMVHPRIQDPDANEMEKAAATNLGGFYGYSGPAGEAAPRHVASILRLLSDQLKEQKAKGEKHFVGDAISAIDIYWTCFSALISPLPEDVCALKGMRSWYDTDDPIVTAAIDPILLEHRDFIYDQYIGLPLDF